MSNKKIINKEELSSNFLNNIKNGCVFIYPTDTIYGIGCNAKNSDSVNRIRSIKDRYEKPFSVIAPSKMWIYKNCDVDELVESWVNRLPGPYTLIFRLKNKKCISSSVNCDKSTIGVRMPKHWFTDVVEKIGAPIITTSVNKSGKPFMTSMEDLDKEIENSVDFIIYEGVKLNRPSNVIDLSKDGIVIEER